MRVSISALLIIFIFSKCSNVPTDDTVYRLTKEERFYCDSMQIDTSIITELRSYTDSSITPLPENLENILNVDMDFDSITEKSPGFIFNASISNSDSIVVSLYDRFEIKGYTIFTIMKHFGASEMFDNISILKTINKYDILKQVQINGINWDIDTDSVINIIKVFDRKYSLKLIGASNEWCEFIINKSPESWLTLANEVYKVCPDVVDQEAGSVEKLANEMKKSKRLYFWWD